MSTATVTADASTGSGKAPRRPTFSSGSGRSDRRHRQLEGALFPEPSRGGCPTRRLRAAGRLGDLGELYKSESGQDLPPEQLRVIGHAGIGLVPTPTTPDVDDNGTPPAWPLHEPTEPPVGEARQGTQRRPCTRAGRRERRAGFDDLGGRNTPTHLAGGPRTVLPRPAEETRLRQLPASFGALSAPLWLPRLLGEPGRPLCPGSRSLPRRSWFLGTAGRHHRQWRTPRAIHHQR